MLVLDAGALIAIDRGDRRVAAMLQVARLHELTLCTSAAVVAQVWRNGARQSALARALPGIETVPLDPRTAKRLGTLLGAAGGRDVVDAHVAHLVSEGDQVLTSDSADMGGCWPLGE
jgi:PIN domain